MPLGQRYNAGLCLIKSAFRPKKGLHYLLFLSIQHKHNIPYEFYI
jgi:hypothetical protein